MVTKSLLKEARRAASLTLDSDGMLLRFDPDNLLLAHMCLLGPESTPYEHCFFLLSFTLAGDHPASPPTAAYLTNNGLCRFNPNLYIDGYVCLSILGTWEGPGWTPSTLEAVGQTIRASVLIDAPLRCEPGLRSFSVEQAAPYSQFVEYYSLEFAIEHAIETPPPGFAPFRDQLIAYFVAHMDFYMAKLAWLAETHDEWLIDAMYEGLSVTANYAVVAVKLLALYENVTGEMWVKKGDAGFDPRTRIWYPECDPAVAASREPTHVEEEDWDEFVMVADDVEQDVARLEALGAQLTDATILDELEVMPCLE
jgi:ubiquitin-protein ligase